MSRWDADSDLDYRESCGDVDEHALADRLREEAAVIDFEQQSRDALLDAFDRSMKRNHHVAEPMRTIINRFSQGSIAK